MAARGFGWLFKASGAVGAGLYAWGQNGGGQLGQGNTTARSSPVQVGTLTTWDTVSAGGASSLALKSDNTLWAFGGNGNGQLGTSNQTSYSSPVQVGALTDWDKILSTVANWAAAIKTNGTLWSWGSNSFGYLGHGDTTGRNSPVQVGALTTWAKLANGPAFYNLHAIRNDNTLWVTGFGYPSVSPEVNQPGPTVSATTYSSPVQVSSAIAWSEVATGFFHALAITTGGALYAWGHNTFGECGRADFNNPTLYIYTPTYGECGGGGSSYVFGQYYDTAGLSPSGFPNVLDGSSVCDVGVIGTTIDVTTINASTNLWGFSSPVQIGALTTWSKVAAGNVHSLAIKTDGTLWAWGDNGNGQLGLGNTTNRSSPVQVGAGTTWARVLCGSGHTIAVKTDGTLWAWGNNSNGQLGLGDTTNRSSPVQVGTATNWLETGFDAGNNYTLAIRG
jgi:alpha-tubulin suppressor-like RCC1 family protein